MARTTLITAVCLLAAGDATGQAVPTCSPGVLSKPKLAGRILDFTRNNGADRRVFSPALGGKRDLYVYLPPGFDPCRRYPAMLWLHGQLQSEQNFLNVAPLFDEAIAGGLLPPMIIAAPDGTVSGNWRLFTAGSFYINSGAGRFEDYTAKDIWGFVRATFPVRPERQARVIAGASMGGFGAYNLGIKYRREFGVIVGVLPAINLRYDDCRGGPRADFDPKTFRPREEFRPRDVAARFGPFLVRLRTLVGGVITFDETTTAQIARENPTEMLTTHSVRPGEFQMYIGYGTKDQFNIDAQSQSFVYLAMLRGLKVTEQVVPGGRHSFRTGVKLFPGLVAWLGPRLAPYAPR